MNLGEINFIELDFKIYVTLHEAMFPLSALEQVSEREFLWQGKLTNLIRDRRENFVEVFLLVHSQQDTSEKLMLLVELQSALNAIQHTTRISLVKCKEHFTSEILVGVYVCRLWFFLLFFSYNESIWRFFPLQRGNISTLPESRI